MNDSGVGILVIGSLNGVLVVDKPLGPTSHDVVAIVRRALGIRQVGHTGTLDPLATGVLPLVVGRATRLARFFTAADKEYVAGIRFGAVTATYDAEDRVRTDGESSRVVAILAPDSWKVQLTPEDVRGALSAFEGTYWQLPPPFSAKKIQGVRAYKLARTLKPVELKPVEVTVRRIELISYERGLAIVRVECSSGFYVRTLAHDLGQRLGCGAYLESLRRTRVGEFDLAQAVSVEMLTSEGVQPARSIIPMPRLLAWLPAVVLTERGAERASHGNAVTASEIAGAWPDAVGAHTAVRLLDRGGNLVGIAEGSGAGVLHPSIVLV